MKAHLMAFFAVVVVAFALVGLFLYWESGRNVPPPVAGELTQVPVFEAKTLQGVPVSPETYRGSLLVVNFWASWCAPCVEEVPSLVRLAKEMGGQVRILGISNDSKREEIDIFLKSFPEFNAPLIDLVHDEPPGFPLAKMFGVGRLPESYIFDVNGKFVRRVIGTIDWATPEAISYMKSLLEPRP